MYNKFRELFYRNASIAFTITGTSLLVIHYTLATNVQESMAFNLWLVFFAGIQIVGGFIFGTYVQKLYATANTDFLTGLGNIGILSYIWVHSLLSSSEGGANSLVQEESLRL